jgi:hypothetical protein
LKDEWVRSADETEKSIRLKARPDLPAASEMKFEQRRDVPAKVNFELWKHEQDPALTD